MSVDPKDEVDRAIDEALGTFASEEPRRVTAASVREELGQSRRSFTPVWLALAAVLVIGIAVSLNRPPVQPVVQTTADRPVVIATPLVQASPSPEPSPRIVTGALLSGATRPRTPNRPRDASAPDWGLPVLAIASIDAPEALITRRLGADPLDIPPMEIAPLSISSLSPENEHKQ